jgi:hypothetical protein
MWSLVGSVSTLSEVIVPARSKLERVDIGLGLIDLKKRKLSERSGRVFAPTNREQRVSDMRDFVG